MIKYIGFIGSLFIVLALLIPVVSLHLNVSTTIYISASVIFSIAGISMLLFAIWWLADIYSINGVLSKLLFITANFIVILIFTALNVYLYLFHSPTIQTYIVSVSAILIAIVIHVFLVVNLFKSIYIATDIYPFLLSSRFFIYSILLIPLFTLIFWLILTNFYNTDFFNISGYFSNAEAIFSTLNLVIALFIALLISYGLIVSSFIFLAFGFLAVDSSKEEEKIKEEIEELEI